MEDCDETRIDSRACDRAGTVAQVKVFFVIDSSEEVTDFLNMVEIDGRWRIVNIVDF